MTSQETLHPKKRGRPKTTGKGLGIQVRLQPGPLKALDEWIETHRKPKPSRPEAIRKLCEDRLAATKLISPLVELWSVIRRDSYATDRASLNNIKERSSVLIELLKILGALPSEEERK